MFIFFTLCIYPDERKYLIDATDFNHKVSGAAHEKKSQKIFFCVSH